MINWFNSNQGFLLVILTLIYVITTVLILISNWKMRKQSTEIQKQNLKLVLLEKRVEIYTILKAYLGTIISKGTCSHEDSQKFLRDSRDVNIFFDDDITNYVDVLYKKGIKLTLLKSKIDSNGSNRNTNIDEEYEIISWICGQALEIANLFDKYINVSKLGL